MRPGTMYEKHVAGLTWQQIADKAGITLSAAYTRARTWAQKHGHAWPPSKATTTQATWRPYGRFTDAQIARLGTVPDLTLAAEWGCSSSALHYQRTKLGITRYRKPPPEKPPRVPRLPQPPPPGSIAADEAKVARLGTAADKVLAEEWGCSRERVRQLREKRGIPAYAPPIPEALSLIGQRPDAEVAALLGVQPNTVGFRRRKLGLPCPPGTLNLGRNRREDSRGARGYRLAAEEGRSWVEIAAEIGATNNILACMLARGYALRRGLPWPLKHQRKAAGATA